jgi:hypothetical protein
MAMSPSNPGNKPKTSSTYGNPYQGVKKPSGMKSGSGYGSTTKDNNKTATRGSGGGIGQAVGHVK